MGKINMGNLKGNNLKVYRLAVEFSDELWTYVRAWDMFDRETIGAELVKASDKVGSSIANGLGMGNVNEHHKLIKIARGYLNETMYWLNRAHSRNLIDLSRMLYLKSKLEVLISKLNSYSRAFEARSSRNLV